MCNPTKLSVLMCFALLVVMPYLVRNSGRITTWTARVGLYVFHFTQNKSRITLVMDIKFKINRKWRWKVFGQKGNLTKIFVYIFTSKSVNVVHAYNDLIWYQHPYDWCSYIHFINSLNLNSKINYSICSKNNKDSNHFLSWKK